MWRRMPLGVTRLGDDLIAAPGQSSSFPVAATVAEKARRQSDASSVQMSSTP